MRNRKRHRPEDEYTDETSSVGVFSHSRASDERALDGIRYQVQKRRKRGVNTRFDRMVETMNVTRPTPTTVSSNRARSSSLSSYDAPKTPSDAYNYLHQENSHSVPPAPRGKNHAVSLEDTEEMYRVPSLGHSEGIEDEIAPLPGWLAHTFLTLDKRHPLRSLLPKDIQESSTQMKVSHHHRASQALHITSPPPSLYEDDFHATEESGSVFAFGLPEQASPVHVDTGHSYGNLTSHTTKSLSSNFIRKDKTPESEASGTHLGEGLATTWGFDSPRNHNTTFLPFAKPGPCSSIAALTPASNQNPSKPLLFNFPPITSVFDVNDSGSAYDMHMLSRSQMLDDRSFPNPSFCATSHGYTFPKFNMDYEDDLMEENTCVDGITSLDSIPSSDTPGPSSDTLTNLQSSLFATPGPGYRTAHPVYFDSPAEDPSNSDPLDESEYQVDWGDINFQWKPFLRGHHGEEDIDIKPKPLPIPVLSEISSPSHHQHSSVTNQMEMPASSVSATPPDQWRRSPEVQPLEPLVKDLSEQDMITYDLFVQELDAPRTPTKPSCVDFQDYPSSQQSLAPDSPWTQASVEAPSCGRLTPEGELGPVFAPAPGIYISPLKEAECSDSSQLDQSVTDADKPRSQPQPQPQSTGVQSPPVRRRIRRRMSSGALPLSPINEHPPTSSQITIDSIESWEE